jgi:putative ABC transport system substrate-binding protein
MKRQEGRPMRRRDFIAGLGGVTAVWPTAARAQLPERVRRIGVLMGGSERDAESLPRVMTFRQSLEKLGWTVGRNLRVDYCWSMADIERTRVAAAELGRSAVDVIVADGTTRLTAVREATRTIPIVFVFVSEPVAQGFVASFAHPGGNITGFTGAGEPTLAGKLLGLLKEIAPSVKRVSVMWNPATSPGNVQQYFSSVEAAARTLAVEAVTAPVHEPAEIEAVMTMLGQEPGNGLIVAPDNYTTVHRKLVLELAARNQLPAIYAYRYFVADGGLASYGVDPIDPFRQAAGYVDRILRGEKPADLPVQQPTKFELVINLKTAKVLGLTVPNTLLVSADEVIE